LHKIRPILDRRAIRGQVNSPKHQSIGEGMIKFKKRSFARQYMTNKPVRRGLKNGSDPAADERQQRMKAWS
uniref:Uncharacterized protein n=1 Tax=Magallana gigas TaxID=29159 RepID=A0A8W8IY49_MAGGI